MTTLSASSYFLSTKEINKVRKLRLEGLSLVAISKIVKRSQTAIYNNTLNITNVDCRSKRRINQTELMAIRRMRNRGDTLQSIADAIGRTSATVYNYTKDIVNGRRHNRIGKVNLKTGVVGKGYVYC
jgi:transcriptional regulator